MNVGVENIANSNDKNGDQYPKFLIIQFFAATKLFLTRHLDQSKSNQNEPQKLPSEFILALKKMAM